MIQLQSIYYINVNTRRDQFSDFVHIWYITLAVGLSFDNLKARDRNILSVYLTFLAHEEMLGFAGSF